MRNLIFHFRPRRFLASSMTRAPLPEDIDIIDFVMLAKAAGRRLSFMARSRKHRVTAATAGDIKECLYDSGDSVSGLRFSSIFHQGA